MSLIDSTAAYWKMDETSGGATDVHAGIPLSDNGGVGTGAGVQNTARDFERGSTQWLSAADTSALRGGDRDFSLALWINVESWTAGVFEGVIGKSGAAGNYSYHCFYNDTAGRLRWGVSPDGTALANVDATSHGLPGTAAWLFVVLDHDAANNVIGIQINNGTRDTAGHSGGVFAGTATFMVGRALTTDATFDGRADEVGFFNKVLTTGERAYLYNGGSGRTYEDLAFSEGLLGVTRPDWSKFPRPKLRYTRR